MTTTTIDTEAKASRHGIDLTVTLENLLDIRVAAASFKMIGEDFDFPDDIVHSVTVDGTDVTQVVGWIQKDNATGDAELVVDEMVLDGSDEPYEAPAGKTLLHRLFDILAPAASADITDEELRVSRIVAPA